MTLIPQQGLASAEESCGRLDQRLDENQKRDDENGKRLEQLEQRLDQMQIGHIENLECQLRRCIRVLLMDMARKAVAGAGPALVARLLCQLASADICFSWGDWNPSQISESGAATGPQCPPPTNGTESRTSGCPG
jgi:hypothetical protein